MTATWLVYLAAVLLPVAVSFVVPPAAGVSIDPWRVRRARGAILLFAIVLSQLYLAPAFASGELSPSAWVWLPVEWMFLFGLVVELRRGVRDPFPGQSRRAASRRPRHVLDPIEQRAWWVLCALWVPIAAWLLISAQDVIGAAIPLSMAALLLILGPFLAGRGSLAAEPMLPGHEAALGRAYAARRRFNTRATMSILTVAIVSKTVLAAVLGSGRDLALGIWLLALTLAALALLTAIGVMRARRLEIQVRSRQTDAADQAARGQSPAREPA